MSQKSIKLEEQSPQKEPRSKPASSLAEEEEDPYVLHDDEGENKEDTVPSAILRSPLDETYYDNDNFLKMVKGIAENSLSMLNDRKKINKEEYQLEHEEENSNESSNPLPLVLPPLDTGYDDSFIEMVKRIVNQNYRSTNVEEQHSIKDQSFGSILTFGDDDNCAISETQKQEEDGDDDEKQVENPRRALTTTLGNEDFLLNYSIKEEEPLFFDNNKSDQQKKFNVLKKDPLHVNDLEYIASDIPVQSPPKGDQLLDLPILSRQSQLELGNNLEKQQQADDDNSSQSSSQDFSSWLCFDSNDEFQKFKDTVASEELSLDQNRKDVNKEIEEIFQLYSDQDDENKLLIEQIFSGKFSPGELDEDSFSSVDIEKYIINMSTPKRDIVSTTSTGRANQSPRSEEPISIVSLPPQEDDNNNAKAQPAVVSIFSPQEVVKKTNKSKDHQKKQENGEKNKQQSSTSKKKDDSDVFYKLKDKTRAETAAEITRPSSSKQQEINNEKKKKKSFNKDNDLVFYRFKDNSKAEKKERKIDENKNPNNNKDNNNDLVFYRFKDKAKEKKAKERHPSSSSEDIYVSSSPPLFPFSYRRKEKDNYNN